MERKIQEGDYVPDGQGGLTVLSGREEGDGTGLLTVRLERRGEALTAQMEVYSQGGWSPA